MPGIDLKANCHLGEFGLKNCSETDGDLEVMLNLGKLYQHEEGADKNGWNKEMKRPETVLTKIGHGKVKNAIEEVDYDGFRIEESEEESDEEAGDGLRKDMENGFDEDGSDFEKVEKAQPCALQQLEKAKPVEEVTVVIHIVYLALIPLPYQISAPKITTHCCCFPSYLKSFDTFCKLQVSIPARPKAKLSIKDSAEDDDHDSSVSKKCKKAG
uniref:Uncharacterized protein n=1 Tax=Panagrolaimus davidi TaxID=227884 RepID=A0A914RBQ7_9BILA